MEEFEEFKEFKEFKERNQEPEPRNQEACGRIDISLNSLDYSNSLNSYLCPARPRNPVWSKTASRMITPFTTF